MSSRTPLAVGFGCALAFAALPALAADPAPTGQGIAGGALVAAEVTVLTQALAGVEPAWAYVLGGTLAAAAGGYAGYVVERDAEPDASAWLLAGGLAFLIPTVVWVGDAHEARRHPDKRVAAGRILQPSFDDPSTLRRAPPFERRAELLLPLLRGIF
jgi:hypothetical protein